MNLVPSVTEQRDDGLYVQHVREARERRATRMNKYTMVVYRSFKREGSSVFPVDA